MFDLIPLAFLNPEVHQRSLSTTTELRELDDVLMEGDALERSRALRSRRCPTVSVFGVDQERSAENMVTQLDEWSNGECDSILTPKIERETAEVP